MCAVRARARARARACACASACAYVRVRVHVRVRVRVRLRVSAWMNLENALQWISRVIRAAACKPGGHGTL